MRDSFLLRLLHLTVEMQERRRVGIVHTIRVSDIRGSVVLATFVEDHGHSAADFSLERAADLLEGLRLGDNSGELDLVADIKVEKWLKELRLHRISMGCRDKTTLKAYCCEIGCMDPAGTFCLLHDSVSHCKELYVCDCRCRVHVLNLRWSADIEDEIEE